jgi:intracellular multiplication protein IcmD
MKGFRCVVVMLLSFCLFGDVFAGVSNDGSLSAGGVSEQIVGSFAQLARLLTAGSYIAGLAFSIGAIMKFKQHKDNPTQVPIGTPIALLGIAAALLFFPSVLGVVGESTFGDKAKTAGAEGWAWSPSTKDVSNSSPGGE